MYIYEGCLGDLYTSEEPLEYEDLYCEECGDSDRLVGYAETREEAWNLLKDDGWDYYYVQEFINRNWGESIERKDYKELNNFVN